MSRRRLIAPLGVSYTNVSREGEWRLLTDTEAAPRLGLSVAYLRKDRRDARLIPTVHIGGLVRYDIDLIREVLRARALGIAQPSEATQVEQVA
jgi:hypothetical protein